jgi:hypothetical protein
MLTRPERSAVIVFLMFFGQFVTAASAQPPAAGSGVPTPEPFKILDNSFLVEEAFNQEAGVFQNIFGITHSGKSWGASFVQEWPVLSQSHQLSYTLTWAGGLGTGAWSDTFLNYRFQALTEGPGRPAFSPRISAIFPTGSDGGGYDTFGVQVNLPFSKQSGDLYFHWNAGMTWLPSVDDGDDHHSLESPFVAASAIYRLGPMFHPMLELVGSFSEQPDGGVTSHITSFTLSPGGRGGWNIGDHQLILGVAVPITWTEGDVRDTAVFLYASYELPFKK